MQMKSKRRLLALLLGPTLGAGLLLHTSAAAALGLVEAYDAALKNDPAYRSAYYANEGAKENVALGRSSLLPSVTANYFNGKDHSNITVDSVTRPYDYSSKTASVELRQSIVNFDGIARYKQGKAQANASEADFENEQANVAVRVVGAYIEALFKEDQLALARVERDMYRERMKVNEQLFAKGEGTRTDKLETKARLDLAEAQVLEAQDALVETRDTLAGIIGGEVDALTPLNPDFHLLPADTLGFEAWKKIALERNPELKSKLYVVEIAHQEINKARAGHLPKLDFVASYTKADSDTINTIDQASTTRSIGIQLTIPLYSGGQVSASSRQAVAGQERARADLQVETDKVLNELRKNYHTLTSSVERIDALDKAVESSKLLITATTQSIKGGERINLDLLDAQRQLYTSQRDLAQARYGYLLASLKLRAGAGLFSADDVRQMAVFFR